MRTVFILSSQHPEREGAWRERSSRTAGPKAALVAAVLVEPLLAHHHDPRGADVGEHGVAAMTAASRTGRSAFDAAVTA